jgi:hypothetical protein
MQRINLLMLLSIIPPATITVTAIYHVYYVTITCVSITSSTYTSTCQNEMFSHLLAANDDDALVKCALIPPPCPGCSCRVCMPGVPLIGRYRRSREWSLWQLRLTGADCLT